MMHQRFAIRSGEQRLVGLMQTMGENVQIYGHSLNDKYISGPWKRGDTIQKVTGPVAAGVSALLEGTDVLWSGLVDQKLEQPSGLLGRMTRDTKAFVRGVVMLHPLRAAGDAWRGLTSSPILDGIDALGGFHQTDTHYHTAA
jgi:hypothetical protein